MIKRTERKEYKEYLHNYYLQHKDKIKNRVNEWRKNNQDKASAYAMKHNKKNLCILL